LIEDKQKDKYAIAQKAEYGSPSLQPSLRCHTLLFFAHAPAPLIVFA
jgi:hypothetical protein